MSDLSTLPMSKADQFGGCCGSSIFGLSHSFAGSDGFCPLFGLDFVDRATAGSGTGPDDDDEGEEVFGLSSSSILDAQLL